MFGKKKLLVAAAPAALSSQRIQLTKASPLGKLQSIRLTKAKVTKQLTKASGQVTIIAYKKYPEPLDSGYFYSNLVIKFDFFY
jgi:hypothetical protein